MLFTRTFQILRVNSKYIELMLKIFSLESSSLASSDRKNRNRLEKKMGRRGDAIIRKCSGGIRHEFGGSEVVSHYKGQNATSGLMNPV